MPFNYSQNAVRANRIRWGATTYWNEATLDVLASLWKEGHTASRIAELLGNGLTKNAICGAVYRNGFKREPKRQAIIDERNARRKPRVRKNPDRKVRVRRPSIHIRQVDRTYGVIDFLSLKSCHCRWIYDDGKYCGSRKSRGSYCDYHGNKVYVPV